MLEGLIRVTGGLKTLQGVKKGYKGLKRVTWRYRVLEGLIRVTGGLKRLQGVKKNYKGLPRVTKGYKGLQRGFKSLKRFTGVYKS